MSAADWTPEREAKLKVLWTQGLSCSQIAAQLNKLSGGRITRNAVIGKRTRMGLPDREDPQGYNRLKAISNPTSHPR